MSFSAKTEYACIAMLELASRYRSNRLAPIREIAEAHGASQKFLVQILLQLKGAGLVESTRGASGGYRLAKPPQQITVAEVISLMEGPSSEPAATRPTPLSQTMRKVWKEAEEARWKVLEGANFEDLARDVAESSENMYFI